MFDALARVALTLDEHTTTTSTSTTTTTTTTTTTEFADAEFVALNAALDIETLLSPLACAPWQFARAADIDVVDDADGTADRDIDRDVPTEFALDAFELERLSKR